MKDKKLLIIFFTFLLLSKLFFNDEASVNGAFKASTAAYVVALMNIVFIITLIFFNLRVYEQLSNHPLSVLIFIYYVLALCSTVYSPLPIVTAFRSLVGLGYLILISIVINTYKHLNMKCFMRFLWVILLSSFLSSLIFHIKNVGFNFTFGVSSGYTALIACFIAQYFIVFDNDNKYRKTIAVSLIVSAIYMKSFSAIISLYFSLLIIYSLKRNYILVIILILSVVIPSNMLYLYLLNNPEQLIFGKKAGAYLIGSGRFDVYQASWDLFFNKLEGVNSVAGVGFQAEREYLKDYNLTWSTDPHNSLITSMLGMGYLGGVVYFMYILYPFLGLLNRKLIKNKNFIYSISCHLGAVVYGVTSSQYLGAPTILMIVTTSMVLLSYKYVKSHQG